MMNGFTPIVIEGLSLLAIFALANALTKPLRLAITDHEYPTAGLLQTAKNLIGYVSRPLAVLAISELVLVMLRLNAAILSLRRLRATPTETLVLPPSVAPVA